MELNQIKNTIIYVFQKLVDKNYKSIIEEDISDFNRKITEFELIERINEDCQGELTMPPNDYFNSYLLFVYSDNEVVAELDMWEDGQKGDLTLKLLIKNCDGEIRFGISDLLVM